MLLKFLQTLMQEILLLFWVFRLHTPLHLYRCRRLFKDSQYFLVKDPTFFFLHGPIDHPFNFSEISKQFQQPICADLSVDVHELTDHAGLVAWDSGFGWGWHQRGHSCCLAGTLAFLFHCWGCIGGRYGGCGCAFQKHCRVGAETLEAGVIAQVFDVSIANNVVLAFAHLEEKAYHSNHAMLTINWYESSRLLSKDLRHHPACVTILVYIYI